MNAKSLDRPTEDQCVRIRVIDARDSLGYRGVGREEHSGENAPAEPRDFRDEIADNADAPACASVQGCRVVCVNC